MCLWSDGKAVSSSSSSGVRSTKCSSIFWLNVSSPIWSSPSASAFLQKIDTGTYSAIDAVAKSRFVAATELGNTASSLVLSADSRSSMGLVWSSRKLAEAGLCGPSLSLALCSSVDFETSILAEPGLEPSLHWQRVSNVNVGTRTDKLQLLTHKRGNAEQLLIVAVNPFLLIAA